MTSVWHIYVIQCADGSFYTGITTDVQRRLSQHNSGRGSKYVRSRLPATLRSSAVVSSDVGTARSLEMKFKKLSRSVKEKFVLEGLEHFVQMHTAQRLEIDL